MYVYPCRAVLITTLTAVRTLLKQCLTSTMGLITDMDDKCLKDVEAYDVYPFMAGFTRLAYRGYHRPIGGRAVVMLVNECIEKSREENSYHGLERDVLVTHASQEQYVPKILYFAGGGDIVTKYLSLVLSETHSNKYTDNTVPSAYAFLPYSNKLQLARSAAELIEAFDSFPLATLTSAKHQDATFHEETKPILYADFSRFNFGFNDRLELKVIDMVSLNNVVFHEGKAIANNVPCTTSRDCAEAIVKVVRPTKNSFALLDLIGENATDCGCDAGDGTMTTGGTMRRCNGMDQRAHMKAMCVLYIRPLVLFSNEIERLGERLPSSQSQEHKERLLQLSHRITEGACSDDAETRFTVQQVRTEIDNLLNMTEACEASMTPEGRLQLRSQNEEDLSTLFNFSKPNLVPNDSFMRLKQRWSEHSRKKRNCFFLGNIKTGLYDGDTLKHYLNAWKKALSTQLPYFHIVKISMLTAGFALVLLNWRFIQRVGIWATFQHCFTTGIRTRISRRRPR